MEKNEKRAVTLTDEQWNKLVCYLLMTTKHREGERDAWAQLAKELNEDGTPKFPNAAANAQYWTDTIAELEVIMHAIDGF